MHRLRAWALITGIALAAVIGLIVAFNMSGSGTDAPEVFAGGPTPKPGTDGNFAGIYDVLVHNNDKYEEGLFHCIIRLDDDAAAGDNDLKAAAQCYVDTPGLAPGSPLVDTADTIPGPPPPPPYGTAAPTKLNGSYTPGTDTIALTGCFSDVGGSLGPNVIAVVTIPNAKATLGTGILSGTVLIYDNASNAQCAAKTPSGTPPQPLNVNLERIAATPVTTTLGALVNATQQKIPVISTVGFNAGWLVVVSTGMNKELMVIGGTDVTAMGCDPVPAPCFTNVTRHVQGTNDAQGHNNGAPVEMVSALKRKQGNLDFDGDGCPDSDELAKTPAAGCGDDPYNPLDSDASIDGPFYLTVTAMPADWNTTTNALIPGTYVHCIGNTVQTGNLLFTEKRGVLQAKLSPSASSFGVLLNNPSKPIKAPSQIKIDNEVMTVSSSTAVSAGKQTLTVLSAVGVQHAVNSVVYIEQQLLDINVQCYTDSPLLFDLSGKPFGPDADGLAGAPPPPPYTDLPPARAVGSIVGDVATHTACFANLGGALGPNIITIASLDIHTGQGSVDIYASQENDNCDADPPTPEGSPAIAGAPLASTEQPANWDSEGDGCTDADELGKPHVTGCGDDPWSPIDSDSDLNSAFDIQVTAVRADVCKAGAPAGVPPVGCNAPAVDGDLATGSYFHCKADIQHTNPGTTNNLAARVMCYTDNDVTTVNCQDAAGSAANPCVAAIICAPFGPAHPSRCGNGLPGMPPPSNAPKPSKAGSGSAYGDVDATHTVLSGQLDKPNNEIELEGCFAGVENPTQGPNIYARTVIDSDTGQGTVDIWLNQGSCAVPGGAPTYNDAAIRIAEQATKNAVTPTNQRDSDLDGCSDKQELRDTQASGGRRDPYNRWDLMAVWHGSPLIRDKTVNAADLAAVVLRFGSTDTGAGDFNRNSNPTLTPNPPITPSGSRANYHPAFDRDGTLVGSNAWNLKPPNGNVGAPELANTVAQFGHNCNT